MPSPSPGWSARWGTLSPAGALPGGGRLVRGRPTAERGWYTWATEGLRPEADGLELVTYAVDDDEWPGRLLAELAGLAATPGVLQPGQVLDLGGPVDGVDSTLTGCFLLPPYFEPESVWEAAPPARGWLLWACPITTAERGWATLAGADALWDVLREADLRPGPLRDRESLV